MLQVDITLFYPIKLKHFGNNNKFLSNHIFWDYQLLIAEFNFHFSSFTFKSMTVFITIRIWGILITINLCPSQLPMLSHFRTPRPTHVGAATKLAPGLRFVCRLGSENLCKLALDWKFTILQQRGQYVTSQNWKMQLFHLQLVRYISL